MKLTSSDIKAVLQKRYSQPEFSFFTEVKTGTGAMERSNYIDAVAVGLWSKDPGIYCMEIKVSRPDFVKDASRFNEKQGTAFANCNMFYYVTPVGLITPEELPENTGLMEIQNGGRVVIKKVAPWRNLDIGIHPDFLKSLSRHILSGTPSAYQPTYALKFLGKDTSLEAVDAYVEKLLQEKKNQRQDYRTEAAIEKAVKLKLEDCDKYKESSELLRALGKRMGGYSSDPSDIVVLLNKYVKAVEYIERNKEVLEDVLRAAKRVK